MSSARVSLSQSWYSYPPAVRNFPARVHLAGDHVRYQTGSVLPHQLYLAVGAGDGGVNAGGGLVQVFYYGGLLGEGRDGNSYVAHRLLGKFISSGTGYMIGVVNAIESVRKELSVYQFAATKYMSVVVHPYFGGYKKRNISIVVKEWGAVLS